MFCILSYKADEAAHEMAHRFEKKGLSYEWFDFSGFPLHDHLSLRVRRDGTARRTFRHQESTHRLEFDRPHVIWLRRPSCLASDDQIQTPNLRHFAATEADLFIAETLSSAGGAWFPTTIAQLRELERQKGRELERALSVGFDVPDTLVTNDPADFRAFYREYDGNVIYKRYVDSLRPLTDAEGKPRMAGCYTRQVQLDDMAFADRIQLAPVTLQEMVNKAYELRVTVVGSRVFVVRIESSRYERAKLDWRPASHDPKLQYHIEISSPDFARKCVQLIHGMGLKYGTLDFIQATDGRLLFLEVNPTGEFHWLDVRTGIGIGEAIFQELLTLMEQTHGL